MTQPIAAPASPQTPTYNDQTSRLMNIWAVVGASVALASLVLCIWAAVGKVPGGKATIAALAAAWAVLPPVWFWWEYFYVFRTDRSNPGTWEYFKHGQQLGVAIWAGMAASIAAFAISSLSDPDVRTMPKLECNVASITVAAASASSVPPALEVLLSCGK